jgi:hypothetical protein
LQFDYITINGLDQNTKERILKDIESSGYKGSKSNYVVSLMNDGLDKREGLRAISSKEEFKTLDERLSSQKEILDSLLEKECEGKIDEQILKKLLIRMYWMLYEIAEKSNAYVDDIIHGSMDELPIGLMNEQERMSKAYHG